MELADKKITVTQWLIFLILILVLKYVIFFIDPLPMFFLGDSASYLHTALTGWIPPDRSFVYGFIIKLVAVSSFSLTSLIALQIFTSGLNVFLLSYSLLNFFSVTPRTAFLTGLVCSIEPLQLLYERYVMTEAFSLFLFATYMVLIFHYLKKPKLIFILFIQIVGTGLISLRLSFLPIVFINTVFLPLFAIPFFSRKYSVNLSNVKELFQNIITFKPFFRVLILHLIISIGLTYSFHSAYRHLNGLLSKKPSAYQYQNGAFLLASWAPVVKPVDFPRTDLAETVFSDLKYDLKNPHFRAAHHFMPGGLIAHINEAVPNSLVADNIARETAMNALKRDPLGVASLAIRSLSDFWNLNALHDSLQKDRGNRPLPMDMLETLQDHFGLNAESFPYLITFTNRYFFAAWPWYLFLLCTPLLAYIAFFIVNRGIRWYVAIVFLTSTISIIVSCTITDGVTVRYLHSMGWMSFLVLGPLIDWLIAKW
jgi:hypothetical protein